REGRPRRPRARAGARSRAPRLAPVRGQDPARKEGGRALPRLRRAGAGGSAAVRGVPEGPRRAGEEAAGAL
ncbi:MAG: hypothetical protein OXI01_23170, partial [Albidovulum sp.]|nr:hypothetical protein [Albidovulum sp.]